MWPLPPAALEASSESASTDPRPACKNLDITSSLPVSPCQPQKASQNRQQAANSSLFLAINHAGAMCFRWRVLGPCDPGALHALMPSVSTFVDLIGHGCCLMKDAAEPDKSDACPAQHMPCHAWSHHQPASSRSSRGLYRLTGSPEAAWQLFVDAWHICDVALHLTNDVARSAESGLRQETCLLRWLTVPCDSFQSNQRAH